MENMTSEMENTDHLAFNTKAAPARNILPQDELTKDVFVAEKIRMHFGKYGQVRDVRLLHRPGSRQARRYCFVTFCHEAGARSAIAATNHLLDGKSLVVRPASSRQDAATAAATAGATDQPPLIDQDKNKEGGTKIFIGGIGQEIDSQTLTAHFSTFGKVMSAEILHDHETKRSRGFAFIDFSNRSAAELACGQKYHTLGKRRVEVKMAQPKSAKPSSEVKTTAFAAPLLDNQALQKVILDQWLSSIKTLQYYSSILSQQYGHQQPCIWPAPPSASHRFSPYFVPAPTDSFGFALSPPLSPLEATGVLASQQYNASPLLPSAAPDSQLLVSDQAGCYGLVAQGPFVQYSNSNQ